VCPDTFGSFGSALGRTLTVGTFSRLGSTFSVARSVACPARVYVVSVRKLFSKSGHQQLQIYISVEFFLV
jgi:hypothetical protein